MRRPWSNVIKAIREQKDQSRLPYTAKLSINKKGEIKIIHDKNKSKQYLSTNPVKGADQPGKTAGPESIN